MKGNNIVFSALLAALSVLCPVFCKAASAPPHPFYVSVTEIRVDTKKEALTVSCRMFTDDLEDALTKLFKRTFDLEASLQDKTVHPLVFEYIQKRLEIGVAGAMQRLAFVGMEQEDDAVWCYLESTNFKTAGGITVTNSLLYDFLPDQVNVIHVYLNEARQSVRLVNPDRVAGFRF